MPISYSQLVYIARHRTRDQVILSMYINVMTGLVPCIMKPSSSLYTLKITVSCSVAACIKNEAMIFKISSGCIYTCNIIILQWSQHLYGISFNIDNFILIIIIQINHGHVKIMITIRTELSYDYNI